MITVSHLNVSYDEDIFTDASLTLQAGSFNVLIGESGIGKTTLLTRLGLLSKIDFDYVIDGQKVSAKESLSKYRAKSIGFVFQENHLLEKLSVKDNILYAAQMSGLTLSEDDIDELLSLTHLTALKDRDIKTLSGGEKQRVAISFAMAKQPRLLLLDEPTSFLDHDNCEQIIKIIETIVHTGDTYVLVATHDQRLLNAADCIYRIVDHRIEQTGHRDHLETTRQDPQVRDSSYHKRAIRLYIQQSRQKINPLLSFLTFIVLTLFLSLFSYNHYYKNDFLKNTINSAQEEVRLYYGPSQLKAADLVTQTITNDIRKAILDLDGIDALIPFYDESASVGATTIALQSYYDLSSHVSKTLNEDAEVYVSHNLEKLIDHGTITVDIDDKTFKLDVAGILDKDYQNAYSNTSSYVVYLPYGTYTDTIHSSTIFPRMYIVHFDRSVNFVETMDKVNIIDPELTVFSKIPLDSLTLINNSILSTLSQTVFLFGLSAFILITYERVKSINNRRYELGLLYGNGCSMKDLIYIVLNEPLILFVILTAMALFIATVLTVIICGMSIERLLLLAVLSLLSLTLLELTSLIALYLVLKTHSIIQLLFE